MRALEQSGQGADAAWHLSPRELHTDRQEGLARPGLAFSRHELGSVHVNTRLAERGIFLVRGEDINYWSLSAAVAIGIMMPIVAFMMPLQRHLVRGIALGAVKG